LDKAAKDLLDTLLTCAEMLVGQIVMASPTIDFTNAESVWKLRLVSKQLETTLGEIQSIAKLPDAWIHPARKCGLAGRGVSMYEDFLEGIKSEKIVLSTPEDQDAFEELLKEGRILKVVEGEDIVCGECDHFKNKGSGYRCHHPNNDEPHFVSCHDSPDWCEKKKIMLNKGD